MVSSISYGGKKRIRVGPHQSRPTALPRPSSSQPIGVPRRSYRYACAASSCSTSRLHARSADHSALRGQPMLHRRRSRRRFLQKAAPHPVSPSPTFTTASQSSRRCPSTACSLGIISPTFSPRPARSTPSPRSAPTRWATRRTTSPTIRSSASPMTAGECWRVSPAS